MALSYSSNSVITAALNNRKRKRLGNKAPTTVFTGIQRQYFLTCIKERVNEELVLRNVEDMSKTQLDITNSLAEGMANIHRTARALSEKERERKVTEFNNKTGTRPINFDVGDYVLRGLVKRESTKKLNVNWEGPFQVTSNQRNTYWKMSHSTWIQNSLFPKRQVRSNRGR